MPSAPPSLPADLLSPRLPTDTLQEGWQHIVRRLEQARDWRTLELCVEHAHAWTMALMQAQVIEPDTYRALVRVREHLHDRIGQRLKGTEQ